MLTGLIVPAYCFDYPAESIKNKMKSGGTGSEIANLWPRLSKAAQMLGDRLIVIANPYNGPGTMAETDNVPGYEKLEPGAEWWYEYVLAISEIRKHGSRIVGYVRTEDMANGTKKPMEDIDTWYLWYDEPVVPGKPPNQCAIDGIFFDELPEGDGKLSDYQDLCDYVAKKKPNTEATNILNYGGRGVPPETFYKMTSSDGSRPILSVFEGPRHPYDPEPGPPCCCDPSPPLECCKVPDPYDDYDKWQSEWGANRLTNTEYLERSYVIVHGTDVPGKNEPISKTDWHGVLEDVRTKGVKWIYITDDFLVNHWKDNPFDTLPSYFDDLLDQLKPPIWHLLLMSVEKLIQYIIIWTGLAKVLKWARDHPLRKWPPLPPWPPPLPPWRKGGRKNSTG